MTPLVTCLTVTYGRVRHLENAIACFLAQDYPNKRLVILNTFEHQKLFNFGAEGVTVINWPKRPETMGEARNIAVGECVIEAQFKDDQEREIFVTWDDDDFALPNHLSRFAKHFEIMPTAQWIWFDSMFFAEDGVIKKIQTASPNTFAFTREAWNHVGGYASMNTGEDSDFIKRVTTLPGIRVKTPPEDITFIYGWGDSALYHLSGHGFDQANQRTGYQRVEETVMSLMRSGRIPRGEVVLAPKLTHDPVAMKADFLAKSGRTLKAGTDNEVCIVQLGRLGDIINILPVALEIHNRFKKPYFMVSREFAPLLDGVSYVTPIITDLEVGQPLEAAKEAAKSFRHVLLTQVWGKNYNSGKETPSYNQESWRLAGMLHRFDDKTLMPLFDRRDEKLEQAIVIKSNLGSKPIILVNLKGHSSPYADPKELKAKELLAEIRREFADRAQVIDLSGLQLGHFYDLLALFEIAARRGVLVTSDTAHLHLAAACPMAMTMIAVVNSKPWLGTVPRANAFGMTLNYEDGIGGVMVHVRGFMLGEDVDAPVIDVQKPVTARQRTIYHAFEVHKETNPYEIVRKKAAQASWGNLPGVVECGLTDYPRNALGIGDIRPLPFLKDVLANAMERAGSEDIIMFTNDDVWLHPLLPDALQYHVGVYGACSAARGDYSDNLALSTMGVEAVAWSTKKHSGRDLFAFTGAWIKAHWEELPDFVLGASEWDLCLAAIIRRYFGIKTGPFNIAWQIHPAELPRGYVAHRTHRAQWQAIRNINDGASQKYNRRLFYEWSVKYAPDFGVRANGTL